MVVYLKDLSPYRRWFSPCSKSQNTIRVNLLGNYSTSYYYIVDTVLTYIPSLIIGPTVVPTTRFRYKDEDKEEGDSITDLILAVV